MTMYRINGERGFPDVPTRVERVAVPLWFVLAGAVFRIAGRAFLAVVRHPAAAAVVVGLAVLDSRFGGLGLAVLLGALALAGVAWRLAHPASFTRFTRWVLRRVRLSVVYRWRWRTAMVHTGLAIRIPTSNADRVEGERVHGSSERSGRGVVRLRAVRPGRLPKPRWADRCLAAHPGWC
jgi:S-DNA-T family DNA segregation ATPase FtsK/SpoIIIE